MYFTFIFRLNFNDNSTTYSWRKKSFPLDNVFTSVIGIDLD